MKYIMESISVREHGIVGEIVPHLCSVVKDENARGVGAFVFGDLDLESSGKLLVSGMVPVETVTARTFAAVYPTPADLLEVLGRDGPQVEAEPGGDSEA